MIKIVIFLFIVIAANSNAQEIDESIFDFWLGDWDVSWKNPDGTISKGKNNIIKILDNKVIQENFESAESNFKGMSISIFDTKTNKWKQTWVDNTGAHLNFINSIENGNPVFKTIVKEKDGKQIIQKMVFKNITKEGFVWEWMGTKDGGKHWKVLWRIDYKRIKV